MQAIWTIYRREMGSYFVSPVAYVLLFVSTLSLGLTLFFQLSYVLESKYNTVPVITMLMGFPLTWFLLFFQPAIITMRTFSEEYKLGTIEMLLSAPVREWEIVIAKFLAAWSFFLVLWSPLVINVLIVYMFSGNHVPPVWSLVGSTSLIMASIGAMFCAVGILASALTRNQIIAAMISLLFSFLLLMVGLLSLLVYDFELREILQYFSPLTQGFSFSQGIFDTRPLVLNFSTTFLALFLTYRLLVARRHQG